MMRTALRTTTAFAFLLALSVPTSAQEVVGGKVGTTSVRAKSVLGAKVAVSGGTSVGTIEDIVLSNEGVVEYLIVADAGKLVTVPWEAAKMDYERRTAVIDVTADVYRKIPTYTAERYPNYYAPTYRTEVYKYYGLKPGEAHRLERRIDRRP